ncbi:hypothetical protein PUNSTDRAFT_144171 [Punctularia strigosozonata HHB-11173 SS5]|uniref:uncharacterized protein n=1 Tax=Punctularia strigosozonata (strain HHB-11173) TaxID=741275 RepID=UPI0004417FC7|nr:uncharacterized protein PUNSTDRAFT_144171 [Punctularia strigosozonata HHB-11173 SS5]EIN07548.1 hypothetical protein PUNSTDRAFT_144171 [Punctularia strigosozonata HHB-11173 SS5]
MDAAPSTSATFADASRQSQAVHHQYGTRTRQNSIMRPSARLRQSPDLPSTTTTPALRRIKPLMISKSNNVPAVSSPSSNDSNALTFPPPHVVLHPDDASNKVFLAIGRSLLAVNNKAVTIKELAEMTLKNGLHCQNVSAASQAITTFIRAHMHRCDVEQDHPLLLRHVLSGTPSDDDLLPALHSRSGGAHCNPPTGDNRLTNFRKGTMVWYLSKAAGAPCPFSRAGIRLCDYGENGKVGYMPTTDREKKRERDRARRAANRGLKRKRLPRACADKGAASDSGSDAEKPPPKVKLTLRLKPSLIRASLSPSTPSPSSVSPTASATRSREIVDLSKMSDSDSDSDDSDDSADVSEDDSVSMSPVVESHPVPDVPMDQRPSPAYPSVRATSMPPYTVSSDGRCLSFALPPSVEAPVVLPFRRSASVTHSDASPPPDSDDEVPADGHDWDSAGARRYSSAEEPPFSDDEDMDADWAFDADEDEEFGESDIETHWEDSPAPQSPPSAADLDDVVVKQEPSDPSAWATMDERSKVVEIVMQAAAGGLSSVKTEDFDTWDWKQYRTQSPTWLMDDDDAAHVKEEDEADVDGYFADVSFAAGADSSRRSSSPTLDFTALTLHSPVSPTVPRRIPPSTSHQPSELQWTDVQLLGPDTVEEREFDDREWRGGRRPTLSMTDTAVPPSRVNTPLPTAPVESKSDVPSPSPSLSSMPSLSSSVRSLDSPEVLTESASSPFFRPSPASSPDARARQASASFASTGSQMDDSSAPEPRSTTETKRTSQSSIRTVRPGDALWEEDVPRWDIVEDHILSVHPPFDSLDIKPLAAEDALATDTPLSPTEEEMFHTLCGIPDWEVQPCTMSTTEPVDVDVAAAASPAADSNKPLRRSKRVAAHAATVAVRERTMTRRSSKRTASATKSSR